MAIVLRASLLCARSLRGGGGKVYGPCVGQGMGRAGAWGDTRCNCLVGEVLVHSCGTSSKDPVGQVPGYWMEEELHSVGNVHKLCRVTQIYSNSRVHGNGHSSYEVTPYDQHEFGGMVVVSGLVMR